MGSRRSYVLSLPGGLKVMQNQHLAKVAEAVRSTVEVNNGLTTLFVRATWDHKVVRLRILGTEEVQLFRTGPQEPEWSKELLRQLKRAGMIPTEPRGDAQG